MARLCPNGHEVGEHQLFCPKCGAELIEATSMFCRKCGNERKGKENFCTKCGTPFGMPLSARRVYQKEPQSKSILPILIIAGIAFVLIGGGCWWYYKSLKTKGIDNVAEEYVYPDDTHEAAANAKGFDAVPDNSGMDYIDEDVVTFSADYIDNSDIAVEEPVYENAAEEETDVAERSTAREEETQSHQEEETDKVFDAVEQMPSFPGGDAALMEYLGKNMRYPPIAEENGIQGRVLVQFVVERDGSISDVKVVRSIDPVLDKEAVRVTKNMPRWKAGMMNGKPVRAKYTMPITFRLSI